MNIMVGSMSKQKTYPHTTTLGMHARRCKKSRLESGMIWILVRRATKASTPLIGMHTGSRRARTDIELSISNDRKTKHTAHDRRRLLAHWVGELLAAAVRVLPFLPLCGHRSLGGLLRARGFTLLALQTSDTDARMRQAFLSEPSVRVELGSIHFPLLQLRMGRKRGGRPIKSEPSV